ncbi:MAG: hypothetical protein ACE5Z5_09155 [Candidatus Bathyarchaeia archaeon]
MNEEFKDKLKKQFKLEGIEFNEETVKAFELGAKVSFLRLSTIVLDNVTFVTRKLEDVIEKEYGFEKVAEPRGGLYS